MNEEKSALIGILLILGLVCGFGFLVGFLTGTEETQRDIKQLLCKQTCTATNDYINCNTRNIDDIIKRINPPQCNTAAESDLH